MKTSSLSFIVLALFLSHSESINAQDTELYQADRQQLISLMNEVASAINNKDMAQIKKHLRADTVIIFHDAKVAAGIPAIENYFKDKLGGPSAVLSDLKIKAFVDAPARFYGNTAQAYGHTIDQFEFVTGNSFELTSKWSATLIKEQNQWAVSTLHFSTNMFSNPLINAAKDNLIWFSIAAFVAGLLLMFGIVKLFKK